MTRIALAGNPNCGKTSLFNTFTGAHQKVGNYGGVTVDFKEGTARVDGQKVTIVDLPGTYSLNAYSVEEQVARDYIVDQRPDVVIDVVDATNLERNLFLTLQLVELGVRPIIALNMWDEVQKKDIQIDLDHLQRLLDMKIVPTVGTKGEGTSELLREAIQQCSGQSRTAPRIALHLPEEIESAINELSALPALSSVENFQPRWVAQKLLERDPQITSLVRSTENGGEAIARADELAGSIAHLLGDDAESLIAEARYGWIAGVLRETVSKSRQKRVEISDTIDTIVTHPVWAYPIFIFFMWLLFQATFVIGEYPMQLIELLVEGMGDLALATLPSGLVRDLLVDGIIHGVGGVIVFLPNILILFLGISILEDTGYMARAAFIMDKVMHSIGLHGKSFVPALMGLGCNVPAIMATRTLESRADRIKTILLAPLISCSARLPVYVLFAGALFPPRVAGNIVFLFQFVLGTTAFFAMGWVFKKTLFRGEDYPFVMELPPYRLPTARSVVIHMWHKAEHYLKKMGGVVLFFSILLWVLSEFPRPGDAIEVNVGRIEEVQQNNLMNPEEKAAIVEALESEQHLQQVRQSYIGRLGQSLAPLVRPLGLDWRAAVSLLTGFVAKEVVVSSMGVLYAVGESDAESAELRAQIKRNFTPLTGFVFMAFVLLYTPCVVALVTMIRELKSFKWSSFAVGYQLLLAWLVAFGIYQGGKILGLAG